MKDDHDALAALFVRGDREQIREALRRARPLEAAALAGLIAISLKLGWGAIYVDEFWSLIGKWADVECEEEEVR